MKTHLALSGKILSCSQAELLLAKEKVLQSQSDFHHLKNVSQSVSTYSYCFFNIQKHFFFSTEYHSFLLLLPLTHTCGGAFFNTVSIYPPFPFFSLSLSIYPYLLDSLCVSPHLSIHPFPFLFHSLSLSPYL